MILIPKKDVIFVIKINNDKKKYKEYKKVKKILKNFKKELKIESLIHQLCKKFNKKLFEHDIEIKIITNQKGYGDIISNISHNEFDLIDLDYDLNNSEEDYLIKWGDIIFNFPNRYFFKKPEYNKLNNLKCPFFKSFKPIKKKGIYNCSNFELNKKYKI